ncbi:hypothetical protein [Mesonia maritima]|uniref:DUF4595 domain-containing protein n=1 Tax=Mesonia maritima TaxID=1793873 RepID=A0ABU1K1S6_9FLAO|nr:hypothetical protein [Mesonia maritima]MDR6299579.1 hypothetical protein [Mesonia maritima]
MTSRYFSILLLLTSLILFSCSKDENIEVIEEESIDQPKNDDNNDDSNDEPPAPNSLKTFTIDVNGNLHTFYFNYENNQIDKLAYKDEAGEITYYSFEYNSFDKISKTIKYNSNSNNSSSVDFDNQNNFNNQEDSIMHFYRSNNSLKEIETWDYGFNWGYAYNSDGLVSRIQSTGMIPVTNIFYDENNKIEKLKTYPENTDWIVYIDYFEFDDNKNPFYKLFDEIGLVIDKDISISNRYLRELIISDLVCISPYNVSEKTEDLKPGPPTYIVEYSYNDDNFPLEAVYYNNSTVVKYTITYDYY